MAKKQKYFQDAVTEQATDLVETLIRKQLDYGGQPIARWGLQGIVIRLSDKLERIINLQQLKKDPEVSESIEDTLRDIAGYAILGLLVEQGDFPLPMKQKKQSNDIVH